MIMVIACRLVLNVPQRFRHSCQIINRCIDIRAVDLALRPLGTYSDKSVVELDQLIFVTSGMLMNPLIATHVNLD